MTSDDGKQQHSGAGGAGASHARRQTRRALLTGAARGAAVLLISGVAGMAGAAAAQQPRPGRSIFGVRLPDVALPEALTDLIPVEAGEVLSTIEAIAALEQRAEVLRLPQSPLSIAAMLPRDLSLETLYAAALPRLVALIDRSERRNPLFADQAGGLLARLHLGEHVVPDALRYGVNDGGVEGGGVIGGGVVGGGGVIGGFGLVSASAMHFQEVAVPPPAAPPVDITVLPPVPTVPPDALPVPPSDPATITLPTADASAMRRSTRFAELGDEYLGLFATAQVREERAETAGWYLTMLRRSRSRYAAVAARTGVPWYFIGAAHGLEASFNFRGHLHNGDFPLSLRTRQVPAGRPAIWMPPSDWESSAIDALRMMGFAGQADWSLARTLYRLEAYNGFGYRARGVPTPYLWSFSNHYGRGKFVADGRWNPEARSQQCGAAVMLKLLVDAGDISLPDA